LKETIQKYITYIYNERTNELNNYWTKEKLTKLKTSIKKDRTHKERTKETTQRRKSRNNENTN